MLYAFFFVFLRICRKNSLFWTLVMRVECAADRVGKPKYGKFFCPISIVGGNVVFVVSKSKKITVAFNFFEDLYTKS